MKLQKSARYELTAYLFTEYLFTYLFISLLKQLPFATNHKTSPNFLVEFSWDDVVRRRWNVEFENSNKSC